METYKIIRHYVNGRAKTIKTGQTLEQVQKHCNAEFRDLANNFAIEFKADNPAFDRQRFMDAIGFH